MNSVIESGHEKLYGVPFKLIQEYRKIQSARRDLYKKNNRMGEEEAKGQAKWFLKKPTGSFVYVDCEPRPSTPEELTIMIDKGNRDPAQQALTLTRGSAAGEFAVTKMGLSSVGIIGDQEEHLTLQFINEFDRNYFYDMLAPLLEDLQLRTPSVTSSESERDLWADYNQPERVSSNARSERDLFQSPSPDLHEPERVSSNAGSERDLFQSPSPDLHEPERVSSNAGSERDLFQSPSPDLNEPERDSLEHGLLSMATTLSQDDCSHYILPFNQPIVSLDCDVAFNGLTSKEKLYAHYLSQAAWYGGMVVPVQTSPESPAIFAILLDLFKSNGVQGLKEIATTQCNFSKDDWKALLIYTTGVFTNAGNYKSFGDTKIVPGVSIDLVESLISKAKFLGMSGEEVNVKWDAVKARMYSLTEREKQLGLGDKGITTYFSANCTQEDAELVNRFMKEKNIEGWMTRVFKTSNGATNAYEIRTAGVKCSNPNSGQIHEFENATFTLTTGDYSYLLQEVCKNLAKAKEYACNETEVKMLDCYVKCFNEGSLDEHKNGSRFWIADKGPAIETYIGFIENYRDPSGIRSEFKGFVSVVNRPMSLTFEALVDNAKHFLTLLPWPKEYEKDEFPKPDFTSLDVLTFAGSGIPAGINIPNYDEIRQHEGFKNVSMGNVIPASYKDTQLPFLSEADKILFNEHRIMSFEVLVGLDELLGHGSGKLFMDTPNSIINPITGQPATGSYGPGETYSSVFTSLSSSYEECRAQSVGLYLSLYDEILKIFGLDGKKAQEVKYVNWLSMVYAGAKSLEMYQPETKTWMQPHSQARFVILQVLIEAGQGLVTVVEKLGEDGKPDLLISVDWTKIYTVGQDAMKSFLIKLQVYKSTADIKEATTMYDKYSAVHDFGEHPWGKWRKIILDKKQPRKAFVQHNTVLDGESVILKTYEASPEGLIQSWIERFNGNAVYKGLDECWLKDKPYF